MKRIIFLCISIVLLTSAISVAHCFADEFEFTAKQFINMPTAKKDSDGGLYAWEKRKMFCEAIQKNRRFKNIEYKASEKDYSVFIMKWPMEGKAVTDNFMKNRGQYLRRLGFKKVIIIDTTTTKRDWGKRWEYDL
jgi:hypothetical protein